MIFLSGRETSRVSIKSITIKLLINFNVKYTCVSMYKISPYHVLNEDIV